MADHRTTITELVTGLGALGYDDVESALEARPAEMVSLSPEQWNLLADLHRGGAFRQEFFAAWQNGCAFLRAADGLRGRRPVVIEWRGNQKQPGDEPVPADLRIDHVFFVSCKYLSKILTNTSPATLFDRLLAGGHGGGGRGGPRGADWYAEVAPAAYQLLYHEAVEHLGLERLPDEVVELRQTERVMLKAELGSGRWPEPLRPAAAVFAAAVAEASAERWQKALADADPERVLWRLLRIGAAPYFVLGTSTTEPLRLRVGTAWDWRQHYKIESFDVSAAPREQPVVNWQVDVLHRRTYERSTIDGHVEIRWAHGKFAQPPEAKVYLDTPHHRIPGYWPLT